MSAAHTPGPWVQCDAFGPFPAGTLVGPSDGNPVCSATGYYGREGAQANARLIAAAPELFSALAALHRICRDCDLEVQAERPTEQDYQAAMDAAEAAIAKAAGNAA